MHSYESDIVLLPTYKCHHMANSDRCPIQIGVQY